jgi:hypothetical protein
VEVVVPVAHKVLAIHRRQVLHRVTTVVQVADLLATTTPAVAAVAPVQQEV